MDHLILPEIDRDHSRVHNQGHNWHSKHSGANESSFAEMSIDQQDTLAQPSVLSSKNESMLQKEDKYSVFD